MTFSIAGQTVAMVILMCVLMFYGSSLPEDPNVAEPHPVELDVFDGSLGPKKQLQQSTSSALPEHAHLLE